MQSVSVSAVVINEIKLKSNMLVYKKIIITSVIAEGKAMIGMNGKGEKREVLTKHEMRYRCRRARAQLPEVTM